MIEVRSEKTLILVDGSYHLYRMYCNPGGGSGRRNRVACSMLGMLERLLRWSEADGMVVVFDSRRETFRSALFGQYKRNRSPAPTGLGEQMFFLRRMIEAMGFPSPLAEGVEGDDVIGTLAEMAVRSGYKVLVSTNDKDLMQLVSPEIRLVDPLLRIIGPAEVESRFGVHPRCVVDYLSLAGDSSDNIPGVPGVGGKTAKLLLQRFGGLDALYQQIDAVAEMNFCRARAVAEKLRRSRREVFLYRHLVTIRTDLVLDMTLDHLAGREPDMEALVDLLRDFLVSAREKVVVGDQRGRSKTADDGLVDGRSMLLRLDSNQ